MTETPAAQALTVLLELGKFDTEAMRAFIVMRTGMRGSSLATFNARVNNLPENWLLKAQVLVNLGLALGALPESAVPRFALARYEFPWNEAIAGIAYRVLRAEPATLHMRIAQTAKLGPREYRIAMESTEPPVKMRLKEALFQELGIGVVAFALCLGLKTECTAAITPVW